MNRAVAWGVVVTGLALSSAAVLLRYVPDLRAERATDEVPVGEAALADFRGSPSTAAPTPTRDTEPHGRPSERGSEGQDGRSTPVPPGRDSAGPRGAPAAEAAPVPPTELRPSDDLELLLGKLQDQEGPRSDDGKDAIDKLAARGPEALPRLASLVRQGGQSFGFRHRAVRVLEKMRSREATELLLDLALGRVVGTNQYMEEWAARGFLNAAVPGRSPRQLLQTQNPRVTNVALAALKGTPIDDTLMEQLERIMRTGPVWVRDSAASAMAADRTGSFAERKARAIVCVLDDLATMDLSAGVTRGTILTPEERWYWRFIAYLCDVWDANSQMDLRPAQDAGRARDAVVIARSRRGDGGVASELQRILRDPQAGMFRAWAAEGLGKIGTKDHIEILTHVAQSDGMRRETPGPLPPGRDPTVYPVREAALKALNEIRAREHLP